MKYLIYLTIACFAFGGCSTYLPHSSLGVNSSILSKPIRKGKDTSCFTVESGRSENWFVNPDDNTWWDSIHYPIINSSLNNFYGEVSWIKCHKHMLYGGSLFGYFGEYKTWTDRQITRTADYYGLGTKLLIGMNMNYKHVNFQPIFLQTSFAKDFGTYVSIRENFELADGNANVVPADAIAITYKLGLSADFLIHKPIGFGLSCTSLFEYYATNREYAYFSRGYQGRLDLRIHRFRVFYAIRVLSFIQDAFIFGVSVSF